MNQSEIAADTMRARKWFQHNRYHYDYDIDIPGLGSRNMQAVFDELLDLVETPFHLDLLSEAFEDRKIRNNRNKSETQDRAAQPTLTPGQSRIPSIQPKEVTV